FNSVDHTDVQRTEKTLARISDGSSRARPVHVLGMCLYCSPVSSVVTGSANDSQRRAAATGDGNSDGLNRNSHHLFTAGPEIGSAFQSIGDVDVLSARENRSVGCSLLHTVSIRRRYRRRDARIAHVSSPRGPPV